jgi:2-amino-4-hydroxy-6-hydroxymethyldihydropteridine diphosphokinase
VEQDDFYNIAIRLNTSYSPRELLNKIHQIETALKRIRLIHWGPRTIDLDILFYDDQKIQEDDLVVPHPEIQNRRFVLIPMLEIVDNSELKKKIEIMLVNTPDKNKVEKYEEIY